MFMQNIVRIETPSTVTRWVTSYGHDLKMENRGNELRLTRYWNKDGKKYYKEYILIPYLDGRGSLRGYIETPDLAERLYLGENAHGTVAYTILKLSNKDDKVLLPTKSDDSLPVHKIKFTSTDCYMNLNQFLGTDEIELKGAWEEEEKKEDAICASMCNFPRNDHGVTTSSGYLYVPCKTQDKFENEKEEEEETKKEKVNIVTHWLRMPLWPEYTMLYGGTVQLWNLERNEYPVLRIVHDREGAEHHILHFAMKSVMVDVTKALSPKEGDVLDYGITVVDKPVERVQSYADRFSTIDSAEVVRNAKTGELEIKVTYRLISLDRKDVTVEVPEPAFTIIKR